VLLKYKNVKERVKEKKTRAEKGKIRGGNAGEKKSQFVLKKEHLSRGGGKK